MIDHNEAVPQLLHLLGYPDDKRLLEQLEELDSANESKLVSNVKHQVYSKQYEEDTYIQLIYML